MRDVARTTDRSRPAVPAPTAPADAARFAHVQAAIGNRALARQVLARDEKKPDAAAHKPAPVGTGEAWSAAGPWGDKVRGLLEDHLTTKDVGTLLGMLPALLGQGAGAAVAAAGDKGVEAIRLDKEEAAKLAESVSTWGHKAAEKWLASKNGKAFLDDVRTKLGENPKAVYWSLVGIVAGALATAIALYAAGKIDPPMLSKDIKLGKDWTLKGGIDLGKPSEQWFQSALLGVGWKASNRLSMDLGSTFAWKKATDKTPETYDLGGTYKLNYLDPTGKASVFDLSLGGGYGFGSDIGKGSAAMNYRLLDPADLKKTRLTLGLSGEYASGGAAKAGASFTAGSWLTSKYGFAVDPEKGWTHTADLGLKGDRLGIGGSLVAGPANTAFTFTGDADIVKDKLKLAVKGVMNSDAKPASTDAEGKPVAGVSDTFGGSLGGKAGGFDYSVAATWNLTEEQLDTLTLHLGYANKAKTLEWLVDLAHSMKGDEATESGKAKLTWVVKDYVLRLEARLQYAKEQWSGGGTASLMIPLGKSGFQLAPMLGVGYGVWDKDFGAEDSWWGSAGVGVGHTDLPVSLYGAWNQPFGGSGLPGFASVGIGLPLGRPEEKEKKK